MRTPTLTCLALAAALAGALPAAALAQDDGLSPEGVEWHLTGYASDATAVVPFFVDATLLLDADAGTATGSTGCNDFTANYMLADAEITFDDVLAEGEDCPQEWWSNVESGYLAALPQVAAWAIEGEQLRLTAGDGRLLLELEQPVLDVTRSDLAEIAGQLIDQQARLAQQQDQIEEQLARIDRLDERLDDVRIGTLRERISTLESQLAALQRQVGELAPAASSGGSAGRSSFRAAEKVLRKAIPARFRETCTPLRRGLPSGTVAAISCDTASAAVAEAAYYLMEYDDAATTLRSVASANGVPNRRPRCNQRASWWDNGVPVGAEACWVEDDTANVRLVAQAASCRQLDAGATHLTEPVIYLALEGRNARMEPLRAAGLAYTDADVYLLNFDIGRSIASSGQPLTPGCRELRGGG
jgi:heat shock protein HslJ